MEISVREISERLSVDAQRVCAMLLPCGKETKGEWVCGDISGSPGDSLKVHLTGQHAGQWRDWADDTQHGDLIDLWRAVKGCQPAEAIKQAKEWLGIAPSLYAPSVRSYAPAPVRADLSNLSESGRAMKFLREKRKLEPWVIEQFKIQGTGKEIVFPCHAPDGRLVNRSYRTLDEKKKVWQDKDCAPCLFGWHALDQEAYRTRTVLLCEGQIDAASWTQLGIAALSIPNGSGQTWIETEWDNLAAFDHIYISFDMDGAGQANVEKAIHRLGRHRCMIVTLPSKDANDCLVAGATAADAKKWIAEAKPPAVKGLVRASELEQRLLQSLLPRPLCFTLPFLQCGSSSDSGFYPRPAEVTVWTGVTSHGKSTFLNYFILSAALMEHRVFIASMESKAETVLRKMMSSFFNRTPTNEDVSGFLKEIGSQLVFADVVGYIGQEQLLEMMQFSQRRYGVTHCVVDSLMRIDGLEEDFVQQGKFLNTLQEFAKDSGVHIHLVAHPRKMAEDGKPGKMDVKGSSLIPNNADNIVAVCRNTEKDKLRKDGQLTPYQAATMYDTEIRVEKQRETGWEGRFLLKFDAATFGYSLFEPAKGGAVA
jgi:twinkle protein